MIKVRLWGSLRALSGGREVLEVEARTLKDVRDRVLETAPELGEQIEAGVSFAVDGVIYRDSWFVDLTDDQEVVMMPRMVGG